MLRACWYLVLLAALLLTELLIADFGALFPGACALAFYLTVSRAWQLGLVGGALLAISIETLLGRQTSALLLLPVVVGAAVAWRRFGERRALMLQILPGALLGLTYASLVAIGENLVTPGGLAIAGDRLLWLIGGGTVAGAVGVPVVVGLADWVAGGLGFERYSTRLVLGGPPTDDR